MRWRDGGLGKPGMRPQRWELGGGQRADDWDLAGQDKESDFTPSEVGSNCRV